MSIHVNAVTCRTRTYAVMDFFLSPPITGGLEHLPQCWLHRSFHAVTSARVLTYISTPRLDDDGTPTAGLLLHLSHTFPGLLVGVVCGTYCDLILDPTQTIQLNVPFTAKTRSRQNSFSIFVCVRVFGVLLILLHHEEPWPEYEVVLASDLEAELSFRIYINQK